MILLFSVFKDNAIPERDNVKTPLTLTKPANSDNNCHLSNSNEQISSLTMLVNVTLLSIKKIPH